MQMMDWAFGPATQWPIYTLLIVVIVFGLILIYLGYMILAELKDMKQVFERVEKLLKSVE